MNAVWTWIADHPGETIALIIAVLSAVNGLLPHTPQWAATSRLLGALLALLDRLAVLVRSDSPGTLKVPGAASRLPNGRLARRPGSWPDLGGTAAVLLAVALAGGGCSWWSPTQRAIEGELKAAAPAMVRGGAEGAACAACKRLRRTSPATRECPVCGAPRTCPASRPSH